MRATDALWIVALSCLATLPAFLRAFPADTDPYYFLAGGAPVAPSAWPFILSLLPMAWLPLLCLASTITIAVTTYYLAKEYGAKDPMLAVFLLFTASLFVFRQNVIEDDLFGYALGLLGTLFWVRYWERDWKDVAGRVNCIAACLAFTVASSWFWANASLMFVGYYALHLAFTDRFRKWWVLWVVPLIGVMSMRFPKPTLNIGEQVPFASFFVGLFILPWGAWMALTEISRSLRVAVIYWSGLGLLMGKFVPMAAPVLAVACEKTISGKKKNLLKLVPMLVAIALVMSGYSAMNAIPTDATMAMCEDVAGITNGTVIVNEWNYGHWLKWYGANPAFTPYNPPVNQNYSVPNDWRERAFVLTGRSWNPESDRLRVVKSYPDANVTLYEWLGAE